ncbi:hypothetical protein FAZ15_16060 [Sphingobacterium olei]|uniref:Peptidase S74 domain-containing protein n=1 Tax=Sphingobacterium olei TaxID=2571155 RepID=A0A4U0NHB4_9SPHI|nr:hypothetical protein [Sphingobacterium olei]TJZ53559.1 hypothetical protein FAZ15_16060 [Sphingobacterium olei]
MKRSLFFALLTTISFAKAQSNDPNIGIGLAAPHYGINIKANFPTGSGGWARGYRISNQDNTSSFIQLGAMGAIINGVSTLNYTYIGRSHEDVFMVFRPDGNIGVGTLLVENGENWGRVFQVKGNQSAKNIVTSSSVQTGVWAHNLGFYGAPAGGITGTQTNHSFSIITNSSSKMTVLPNGNVGIGITGPTEKLSVNGNIRAKEIKVETANWPDYVFEKDHKLMSLDSLGSFINKNGHLPDIPTAKEVELNGVQVGEMVNMLLKKNEELTLYILQQDKRIKELEKK